MINLDYLAQEVVGGGRDFWTVRIGVLHDGMEENVEIVMVSGCYEM